MGLWEFWCLYLLHFLVFLSAPNALFFDNASLNNYYDDFREILHSIVKVDLLETYLLGNQSRLGIELGPGPHSASPAAYFMKESRQIFLPLSKKDKTLFLLESQTSDIALITSLKQRVGNTGTLVSIASFSQKLFELQSSGRQNVLRLYYRSSPSGSTIVETIPVALADNNWHKLAIMLSGDQLQVFVDCRSVYRRIIRPLDFKMNSLANLTLWIGQSSENHFLYKGYLQNLHLITGRNPHVLQCPDIEASCPTCGEFKALQKLVQDLQRSHLKEITELRSRLELSERRLSSVEECDCSKGCESLNGALRDHGSTWIENCQNCSCKKGSISCMPVSCPVLDCKDLLSANEFNSCCSTCREGCVAPSGVRYSHGSTFKPGPCVHCVCVDGEFKCERENSSKNPCPKLDCSPQDEILGEGQCCKVCKANHCALGHDCHIHANCINLDFNYTCSCRSGFTGDGKNCLDVNECLQLGDSLGSHSGHHCTAPNSRCINTIGSYSCDCLENFKESFDPQTRGLLCSPNNPCDTHNCHSNAHCVPVSNGSFFCECRGDFVGDGVQECRRKIE